MNNADFDIDTEITNVVRRGENLLLLKLKRRARLIAGITMAVFSAAAVGVQLLPKKYAANAQMMVDNRSPRPPVRGTELEVVQPFSEDIIGTKMAILSSHQLVAQVVTRLHLEQDRDYSPYIRPSFLSQWKMEILDWLRDHSPVTLPIARPSEDAWSDTVDTLIETVKLVPVPRSRAIEINVAASSPDKTAAIGNIIADLYIETHLGLMQEMNVEANRFLLKRLGELRVAATDRKAY